MLVVLLYGRLQGDERYRRVDLAQARGGQRNGPLLQPHRHQVVTVHRGPPHQPRPAAGGLGRTVDAELGQLLPKVVSGDPLVRVGAARLVEPESFALQHLPRVVTSTGVEPVEVRRDGPVKAQYPVALLTFSAPRNFPTDCA